MSSEHREHGTARRQGRTPGRRWGRTAIHSRAQVVPILRRQSRLHRLQRRAATRELHPGTRQDIASANIGDLRAPSADACNRNQAGSQRRNSAVYDGLVVSP